MSYSYYILFLIGVLVLAILSVVFRGVLANRIDAIILSPSDLQTELRQTMRGDLRKKIKKNLLKSTSKVLKIKRSDQRRIIDITSPSNNTLDNFSFPEGEFGLRERRSWGEFQNFVSKTDYLTSEIRVLQILYILVAYSENGQTWAKFILDKLLEQFPILRELEIVGQISDVLYQTIAETKKIWNEIFSFSPEMQQEFRVEREEGRTIVFIRDSNRGYFDFDSFSNALSATESESVNHEINAMVDKFRKINTVFYFLIPYLPENVLDLLLDKPSFIFDLLGPQVSQALQVLLKPEFIKVLTEFEPNGIWEKLLVFLVRKSGLQDTLARIVDERKD